MSEGYSIFAERRGESGWRLVGEREHVEAWGVRAPVEALDVVPRSPLITVLTGRTTTFFGPYHSGLDAIAPSRGLPADLSPGLAEWVAFQGDVEERDPTWMLTREILDFDWDSRTVLFSAFVKEELADRFDPDHPEAPFPRADWPADELCWCYTPAGLAQLRSAGHEEAALLYSWQPPGSVEVFWSESHFDVVGRPEAFLDEVRRLGAPESTRLVVWVDP